MAEGGYFSRTLEGGSEALFDHECKQCRDHGSKQEAIDFCKNCKQFLCNMCGRYHLRNMTTHTLVSVASLTQTTLTPSMVHPVPVVAKCHYHPDRDIEMHCGTHDMVYCSLCVAKKHRSCVNVKEIKEVADRSKFSTLQKLVTDITNVNKRLHDAKMDKSNSLKLLKKRKASLLQEINAVRKRMNTHLDALEQKLIAELDAEQNELEKEIMKEIKVVDGLITASDHRKPDLNTGYDMTQMFIIEKLAQVVLTEANSFLKNANTKTQPTLKFEPNDELHDAIEKCDNLGKLTKHESKQRMNYKVKYTADIDVKVQSDTYVFGMLGMACSINDMCQLPDGTILLIDNSNGKLKRLDDKLNVQDYLICKNPRGLCSMSANTAAVRLGDNTVHFVHVGKSLSYQGQISINHPDKAVYSGMVCCNNQLWVPGDRAVYVHSLMGYFVKKIETDSKGLTIFPNWSPEHIAANYDGTKVYVAAYEDRVVVFNKNRDVVTELRDQRLNGTCGICITEDDIVLVAGYQSMNVIMFDRDNNCLGELVPSSSMLGEPCSLCYDRLGRRLFVGFHSSKIQIFQLMTP